MSKILFVGDSYVELDCMGSQRWRRMIIKEFPLIPFVKYMGYTPTQSDLDHLREAHLPALEACDLNNNPRYYHMNDLLGMIPPDRVRELRMTKYSELIGKHTDPAGRDIRGDVQKALVFTMPLIECTCGAVDPTYLYWAPAKAFRKSDIITWIGSGHNLNTGYDVRTSKCGVCNPRLYPQIISHPQWAAYSSSDPNRCGCAACGS